MYHCLQAAIDAADAQSGAAFTHHCGARYPHADNGWRLEWEKNSPELMELLKQASRL